MVLKATNHYDIPYYCHPFFFLS